jgi:hypothetical protein
MWVNPRHPNPPRQAAAPQESGSDGQLWPVRGKGLSVKLREVAGLAEVLAAVAGRIGPTDRQDDRREGPPPARRGSARPPFDATRADDRSRRPGFDEF